MNFKEEFQSIYYGYKYVILYSSLGYRCGYVKIPRKSYLYGKNYFNKINIRFSEISDKPLGKRSVMNLISMSGLKDSDKIRLDMLFDVHGGITFSGRLKGRHGWYLGFDCAHCDDAMDPSIMEKPEDYVYREGTIMTKDDVILESESLIDQIIKYFPVK